MSQFWSLLYQHRKENLNSVTTPEKIFLAVFSANGIDLQP